MSAPLITKQLKHNSFTDVQAQLLNRKVEDVRGVTNTNANNITSILDGRDVATYVQYIRTLENKINRLENAVDNEKIQNIINGKTEQKNYDSDISSLKSKDFTLQSNIDTVNNNLTTLEDDVTDLEEDVKNLVPKGTVMFFKLSSCPKGWQAVTDANGKSVSGYYPRIANAGDAEIGKTKEQMVHKHKHVSPFMAYYGLAMANQLRYGPYSFPIRWWNASFPNVYGDANYAEAPNMYANSNTSTPSVWGGAFTFYGPGYPHNHNSNTYTYTSDGMNRQERFFGINSAGSYAMVNSTLCPNRDVDDKICKPSGNNYGVPYLKDMPLVGNENRPKSIVLLACEKK